MACPAKITQEMVDYAAKNPDVTGTALGKMFGVSAPTGCIIRVRAGVAGVKRVHTSWQPHMDAVILRPDYSPKGAAAELGLKVKAVVRRRRTLLSKDRVARKKPNNFQAYRSVPIPGDIIRRPSGRMMRRINGVLVQVNTEPNLYKERAGGFLAELPHEKD